MRVQVRRLARIDIQSVHGWYDERGEELGTAFLSEVEHVLTRISAKPSQFPVAHRDVRRALLKQFPYAIYFRLDDHVVTVLAVAHQRRAPGLWKSRS